MKNKNRQHQKKSQQKAVKNAKRKVLQRYANESVRRYMKSRRVPSKEEREQAQTSGPSVEEVVTFADCQGVGECCKNRPIYVEPTDVYRILKNERAREKFGLEVSMDLYPKIINQETLQTKPGPLVYQVEEKILLPYCAVHRVEPKDMYIPEVDSLGVSIEDGDQFCPFFEFAKDGTPECILGDDRLTQCKSDPVFRTNRLPGRRRFAGWEYSIFTNQCDGCRQAAQSGDRTIVLGDWLEHCKMEDRFVQSDMFHGFIGWVRRATRGVDYDPMFFWKLTAIVLFDWHRFAIEYLDQPKDEVILNGPGSPRAVYLAARMMLEGVIERIKIENAAKESDQKDPAEGVSESH